MIAAIVSRPFLLLWAATSAALCGDAVYGAVKFDGWWTFSYAGLAVVGGMLAVGFARQYKEAVR